MGVPTLRAKERRRGGASREAAEHLARKLRDTFWRCHEEERVRAELDSHRVPLDLNALIPIPLRVLRKGFVEAGQEWMWGNSGVRWPIRRVSFAIERRDASSVRPVAMFRFLSEDWSPWVALLRMRERWPELRFEMKAGYLGTYRNCWPGRYLVLIHRYWNDGTRIGCTHRRDTVAVGQGRAIAFVQFPFW